MTTQAENETLAARCLDLLRSSEASLATAESLTAGSVAATVAAVPGASDVLRGGVIAYASDVKADLLGVAPGVIASYGVVSVECARAMARGARRIFDATWAVSTTGVAGPDEQEGKPVGTVFVAVSGPGADLVRSLRLLGSRADIRQATVAAALGLLIDAAQHA